MTPTKLEDELGKMTSVIYLRHATFSKQGASAFGEKFESMYNENLKRRPNDENR